MGTENKKFLELRRYGININSNKSSSITSK